MGEKAATRVKIAQFEKEIANLADDFDHRLIEETANRLEGCNYAPPIITSIDKFLRMNRQELLDEIERIFSLPDSEACSLDPDSPLSCENLKVQYITVLIFYYKKLVELRRGNVEEWDEINELYIHD